MKNGADPTARYALTLIYSEMNVKMKRMIRNLKAHIFRISALLKFFHVQFLN